MCERSGAAGVPGEVAGSGCVRVWKAQDSGCLCVCAGAQGCVYPSSPRASMLQCSGWCGRCPRVCSGGFDEADCRRETLKAERSHSGLPCCVGFSSTVYFHHSIWLIFPLPFLGTSHWLPRSSSFGEWKGAFGVLQSQVRRVTLFSIFSILHFILAPQGPTLSAVWTCERFRYCPMLWS